MSKNKTFQLFYLLLFILAGLLVFNVLLLCYFYVSGYSVDEILSKQSEIILSLPSQQMLIILLSSHIIGLMLPAFIFYKVFHWGGAEINTQPFVPQLFWPVGLYVLFSLPLVSFTAQLNQLIPLPEWAHATEDDIEKILIQILQFNSFADLCIAVITIAIIPAIGEEWIFRGIIQKKLEVHFSKPWIAILITACIFSLFHFQFEGFLPRMFLGIVLGFIFFITGNLWYSIFFHLIYNGGQVIAAYMYKENLTQALEKSHSETMPWYVVVVSSMCLVLLSWHLYRIRHKQRNA